MLGLKPAELYAMELSDFIEMVDGALIWEYEKVEAEYALVENMLDWQSFFTANIMISSGNYKKPDVMKMKKGLFQTDAELKAEATVDVKKDVETEKAKLVKRFNLDSE